ncbi:hypothetical protein PMAYCL1PPCAC_27942, partial [Pristionchus mayeri]
DGIMAVPTLEIESNKISMVVKRWVPCQLDQFSPVHRINGYPWRLRLTRVKGSDKLTLTLLCEKSSESVLWKCNVDICGSFRPELESNVPFLSWDETPHHILIWVAEWKEGDRVDVEVTADVHGERWRLRPSLYLLAHRDGILVFGEEKKKLYVNKESLASQSPFFQKLFFSNFKEKNMVEIPIGDVEYEEFSNIIKMVYGFDGASLTDENVHRIQQLADRFELKIVEDSVVSFVLSRSCSFSLSEKLVFAEEYDIPFLRDLLITDFTADMMEELSESPAWDQLSKETTRALLKQICKRFLGNTPSCSSPCSSIQSYY